MRLEHEADGWLTLSEIARRLGEPLQKVAYWRDTHRDLIEERRRQTGPQRVSRLYQLGTFELLAMLMRSKTPRSEVRRKLIAMSRPDAEPAESFEAAVLARLDRIEAKLDQLIERMSSTENES